MASYYTPWTWSDTHNRHYSYLMSHDHQIQDTLWSGPNPVGNSTSSGTASASSPPSSGSTATLGPSQLSYTPTPTVSRTAVPQQGNDDESNDNGEDYDEEQNGRSRQRRERVDTPAMSPQRALQSLSGHQPASSSSALQWNSGSLLENVQNLSRHNAAQSQNVSRQFVPITGLPNAPPPTTSRSTINSFPADVQANIGYLDRRIIRSGPDQSDYETLDYRYRRVTRDHQQYFFVPGRVFKMLWIEPAGITNPGRTRNSTHFSTVRFGEQAFSEIRRFVVVRNKGYFSQCIPVQTYSGRGATKPGLVMSDHGVIHTTTEAPNLRPNEHLTKYSIRVHSINGEQLEAASRVNYGKAYAVEHNVKVLEIGMVVEDHRYLIDSYFESAMRGL